MSCTPGLLNEFRVKPSSLRCVSVAAGIIALLAFFMAGYTVGYEQDPEPYEWVHPCEDMLLTPVDYNTGIVRDIDGNFGIDSALVANQTTVCDQYLAYQGVLRLIDEDKMQQGTSSGAGSSEGRRRLGDGTPQSFSHLPSCVTTKPLKITEGDVVTADLTVTVSDACSVEAFDYRLKVTTRKKWSIGYECPEANGEKWKKINQVTYTCKYIYYTFDQKFRIPTTFSGCPKGFNYRLYDFDHKDRILITGRRDGVAPTMEEIKDRQTKPLTSYKCSEYCNEKEKAGKQCIGFTFGPYYDEQRCILYYSDNGKSKRKIAKGSESEPWIACDRI